MDAVIAFTPGQILALCGAIVTISGAVTALVNLIARVMAPTKSLNARLDTIEKRLDGHDDFFRKDLRRFEDLEDGTRVTQRAILALLTHGIDGNDVDALKEAKRDLEKYLIER